MGYTNDELQSWFAEANQKGFRFIIVGNDRYFHCDSFYVDFANNTEEVFEKAKIADAHGGSCEDIYILTKNEWKKFHPLFPQGCDLSEYFELQRKLTCRYNGVSAYIRMN